MYIIYQTVTEKIVLFRAPFAVLPDHRGGEFALQWWEFDNAVLFEDKLGTQRDRELILVQLDTVMNWMN